MCTCPTVSAGPAGSSLCYKSYPAFVEQSSFEYLAPPTPQTLQCIEQMEGGREGGRERERGREGEGGRSERV